MSTDILDDLKTLHTHAIDARHGYEEALQDAEGRGMTPLFREMIALHDTNAGELASVLARFGELPDESGSFMSTIHRTIISLRSLFGGLDESVLPGLVDGEKRNVSAYVKALTRQDFEPEVRVLLEQQKHRLDAAILSMDAMEASVSR
jgi:uncharacterized protein (TIGR02284 family)